MQEVKTCLCMQPYAMFHFKQNIYADWYMIDTHHVQYFTKHYLQ